MSNHTWEWDTYRGTYCYYDAFRNEWVFQDGSRRPTYPVDENGQSTSRLTNQAPTMQQDFFHYQTDTEYSIQRPSINQPPLNTTLNTSSVNINRIMRVQHSSVLPSVLHLGVRSPLTLLRDPSKMPAPLSPNNKRAWLPPKPKECIEPSKRKVSNKRARPELNTSKAWPLPTRRAWRRFPKRRRRLKTRFPSPRP